MARIRNLRPAFFKDEHLTELPALTRILFQGLWTLADRAGNLEDRPRFIKVEVLPYDDCDIYSMLDELHAKGFIRRYLVDDAPYIHIPKFTAHQRVSGDEAKAPTVIPPPEEPGTKRPRSKSEASSKHVSGRSTEIGVLSTEIGERRTEPLALVVPVVPFDPDHGAMPTRRRNPAMAWEGQREGLGVPAKLHADLLSRMATPDERVLFAWYAETERAWQGKAVGATCWQFWNARFGEWQGLDAARAALTPAPTKRSPWDVDVEAVVAAQRAAKATERAS